MNKVSSFKEFSFLLTQSYNQEMPSPLIINFLFISLKKMINIINASKNKKKKIKIIIFYTFIFYVISRRGGQHVPCFFSFMGD